MICSRSQLDPLVPRWSLSPRAELNPVRWNPPSGLVPKPRKGVQRELTEMRNSKTANSQLGPGVIWDQQAMR